MMLATSKMALVDTDVVLLVFIATCIFLFHVPEKNITISIQPAILLYASGNTIFTSLNNFTVSAFAPNFSLLKASAGS